MLNLTATVVAGGFSQSGPVFWDAMIDSFTAQATMSFAAKMRIIRSRDYRNIGVLGAAAFVLNSDRYGWID